MPSTRTNTRSARSWSPTSTSPECSTSPPVPRHRQGPRRRPFDARRARRAALLPRSTASRAEDAELVEFLVARAPDHVADRAEAGPERPRRDRRLRRAGGQRAPPHRAVPAHRGRHPRHQPEGVERLEGQAAGRPVPATRARAGRRAATRCATDRGAQARGAAPCCALYALPADASTKLCGSSSTSATSCATTPPTSPGTRGTCYCARRSARTPVVKARLSPVGEGLQVLVYTPDQQDLFARICGYFDAPASASSTPRCTPRATATRSTPSWCTTRRTRTRVPRHASATSSTS